MLRSPKHRSLVGQLPRDRLLTETDVRLLPYARTSKASDWCTIDIALPERRIKTGCGRSSSTARVTAVTDTGRWLTYGATEPDWPKAA